MKNPKKMIEVYSWSVDTLLWRSVTTARCAKGTPDAIRAGAGCHLGAGQVTGMDVVFDKAC